MPFVLEIHASKLDSYADCPLRGFAELMTDQLRALGYEVRPEKLYVTPLVGSAIHAGVAAGLKYNVSMNNLYMVAESELKRLIAEAGGNVTMTKNFPDAEAVSTHMQQYLDFYFDNVALKRAPKLIEFEFAGSFNETVTYKTTLDLYGNDDILYDLKTGAIITPAWHQLGFYLLLLRKAGYQPLGAVLDYIQRDNAKHNSGSVVHRPIAYDHLACQEMAKSTLAKLLTDFSTFCITKKLDHIIRNPRSANCNAFYCPLFGTKTCNAWKQPIPSP